MFGIALNLEEESVGAVRVGDFKEIKEATTSAPGHISVTVGDAMLGRVVNALGQQDRRQGTDPAKQFSRSSASPPVLSTASREGACQTG